MKIKFFTIPNLLTLSNLLCGSVAAVAALVWGNLTLAFGLMILAAVFDFFDGFTARLLDQSSPIGLQLDSLADDITFGFAPAAAMYVLYQRMPGVWLPEGALGLIVFAFTAFAALRLAKFNIDDGVLRTAFAGCRDALRLARYAGRVLRADAPARDGVGRGRGRGAADDLGREDVRPQIPRIRLEGERFALYVHSRQRRDGGRPARIRRAADHRALRPDFARPGGRLPGKRLWESLIVY